MNVSLPYGAGCLPLVLPDKQVLGVLEPSFPPPLSDLSEAVREALEIPTAGRSLRDILRAGQARTVAVIVNDLTRSTPTAAILPHLVALLQEEGVPAAGITVVVAVGTHRPLEPRELERVVGPGIASSLRVVNHDCDAPDLVSFGPLSTGNELLVNRHVASADVRITIGEVLFHYYAGFAGGRKSLLPGVTGRRTTMRNHARLLSTGSGIGLLEGNPVHEEMIEALGLCPLHFILNVICDSRRQVIRLVSGDPVEAWLEGVRVFSGMNMVPVHEKADAVIVSSGGYPKDINLFQAHKAMEMASRALKDGGTLLLAAECREGLGHPVFAEWVGREWSSEQVIREIEREFQFGAHKLFYLARLSRRVRLSLFTELDSLSCRRVFCEKTVGLESFVDGLFARYGKGFTVWVIPQGGIVLPSGPSFVTPETNRNPPVS